MPMVHGILDEELERGPPFSEAFRRFIDFLENLRNMKVTDLDSSDEDDFETRLAVDARILLCGHNALKFDFPFLLSEAVRNKMPVCSFEKWYFVDTLEIFRSVPEMSSGCLKLQCLRKLTPVREDLAAHRALEDCIVLRDITALVAESLGLKVEQLLALFARSLDIHQTLLNLDAVL